MDPFSTEGFLRRGECGDWSNELLWTMNCADVVVAFSFFGIAFVIGRVLWKRRDVPLPGLWAFLSVTTFACGLTHLMATVMTWWPAWWMDASMRAMAAVLCLITFGLFIWSLPRIIRIISPAQVMTEQKALTDEASMLIAQLEAQNRDMGDTTRRCVDQVKTRLQKISDIRAEIREVDRNSLARGD